MRKGIFRGKGKNKDQFGDWFLTPDKKRLVLYDIGMLNGHLNTYRIFKTIELEEKNIIVK
jgi:hypothetical protein